MEPGGLKKNVERFSQPVIRFRPDTRKSESVPLMPDKTGDWVRYEDYAQAADTIEGQEEALKAARKALMEARNGLDLGLGCARDLEGDQKPIPTEERSKIANAYLRRARSAHAAVLAALRSSPGTTGSLEGGKAPGGRLSLPHKPQEERGPATSASASAEPDPAPQERLEGAVLPAVQHLNPETPLTRFALGPGSPKALRRDPNGPFVRLSDVLAALSNTPPRAEECERCGCADGRIRVMEGEQVYFETCRDCHGTGIHPRAEERDLG